MCKKLIVCSALLFFAFSSLNAQCILLENGDSITCEKALNTMFDSIYSLETVKFKMTSYERIDGKIQQNQAVVYVNYAPRKIFLRGFKSDGELANEVMYLEGENNNKALISPNGFPYFNLSLDPTGSTIRHNRHLTIFEAGGRYLVDMLRIGMENYMKSGDSTNRFFIEREAKGLIKLTVLNPDYAFVKYTVQPNERMRDLCFRLGIPEYKLIEINSDIGGFDDLEEGLEILIPNFYAKKLELTIRESDFIPLHVKIYDEQGIFSEYRYLYFNCHPYVDQQTFSINNPAYTF